MAWVRLDDQFPFHPKLIKGGPLIRSLQVSACCYAAQFKTDGFIPAEVVCTLLQGFTRYLDPSAVDWGNEMVKLELWEEKEGGFLIHDYLKYNPSKRQLNQRSQRLRSAGQ